MVTRLALPIRSDPVRIVPLHVPDELGVAGAVAPAGPAAQLTYHGGHLLGAVEVSTIFWGRTWSAGTMKALVGQLNAFFDAVLESSLIEQLAEYSVTGQRIGPGRRVGTATVSQPTLPHSISDGAIQHFLQSQGATNPLVPQPTPNSLYFIYLPPGVSVAQGGARSCQAFCGYHNDIAGQIYYAVMPYPDCAAARAEWARSVPSRRRAPTSCARRSPMPCRGRAGTTIWATPRSAISARGGPSRLQARPSSSIG
jgi:hypothetical protein